MTSKYPATPTLDRLNELPVGAILDFIEWLSNERIALCEEDEETGRFYPSSKRVFSMICRFFGVNRRDAENERAAVLKYTQENPTEGDWW